jgi:hypothetical protein
VTGLFEGVTDGVILGVGVEVFVGVTVGVTVFVGVIVGVGVGVGDTQDIVVSIPIHPIPLNDKSLSKGTIKSLLLLFIPEIKLPQQSV